MALRQHHLLSALAQPRFRRLFAVRIAAQYGDGVFQASLAGAVLFNPERAGHASDIATAFAVLLLPYCVLGPFAGVLIDRWWRRGVLTWANLLRAALAVGVAAEIGSGVSGVPLFASALVVISLSRFVLAALGACLPRVVAAHELVTANALTSTVGTVSAALGGGTAIVIRAIAGHRNVDYAAIAAIAVLPYVLAAAIAARFGRTELGPSEQERSERQTAGRVVRGLVGGVRVLRRTPSVRNALAMLGAHRVLYGIWLVSTILLYRNYFTGDGLLRAGLTGLSQVVAGIAIGGALASVVTPLAFRRVGPVTWPGVLLLVAAAAELALVLPYLKSTLLASALVLSFCSQGIKISVDTLVQRDVDDTFRGRVFSLYDMLFNVAAVAAALAVAVALPESGRSPVCVAVLTAAWAIASLIYVRGRTGTGRDPGRRGSVGDHQFSVTSAG